MSDAEMMEQEQLLQAVCRNLVTSFIASMIEDGIPEEQVWRVADKGLKDSGCPMKLERLQVFKRT